MTNAATRLRQSDSIRVPRAGGLESSAELAQWTPRWSCAYCGHRGLRPSRLRRLEFLLFLFGMRPFRCPSCDQRDYRLFFGGSQPR